MKEKDDYIGPQLILAGAGTGKTTEISNRVINLLKNGVEQGSILALTFSNEAARNIRRKIEVDLKYGSIPEVTICTFHSFCAQVIRERHDLVNIRSDFGILDESGSALIVHGFDVPVFNAKRIANTIGKAKDLNIFLEKFEKYLKGIENKLEDYCKKEELESFVEQCRVTINTRYLREEKKGEEEDFLDLFKEYENYSQLVDCWKKLEAEKTTRNVLDYGDLNALALEAMKKGAKDALAERYAYIIVDEFQDTNSVQFELLKFLTSGENKNITVVGDPNQSIYAFRGARTTVIDDFKKHFKIKQVKELDKSWRCSNSILQTAHDVISKNYVNPKDCLLVKNANNLEGSPVEIITVPTPLDEAVLVSERIQKEIKENHVLPENIMVLYRSHNISNILKEELNRRKIRFTAISRNELLYRPEIKTSIAYLALLNNTVSDTQYGALSWWNLFHYSNALDSYDSIKISRYLKGSRDKKGLTLEQVVFEEIQNAGLSEKGIKVVEKIKKQITELRTHLNKPVWQIILEVYELSGLNRCFSATETIEQAECLLNLRELVEIARKFEENHGKGINEFIDYLEILEDMGAENVEKVIEDKKSVKLTTIHGAKGLEAEQIYLLGFSKDKFPLFRGGTEPLIPIEFNELLWDQVKDLEEDKREKQIPKVKKEIKLQEERRLAYVAFTRAKSKLIITHPKTYNDEEREISEFLKDIKPEAKYVVQQTISDAQLAQSIFTESIQEDELKKQKLLLLEHLEQGDINHLIEHAQLYIGLKKGTIQEPKKSNIKQLEKELEKIQTLQQHFEYPSETTHSVSTIGTYHDCPKKYELANILHMPTKSDYTPGNAMDLGSFFHEVAFKIAEKVKKGEQISAIKKEISKIIAEVKAEDIKFEEFTEKDIKEIIEIFWLRQSTQLQQIFMAEGGFYFEDEGIKFAGYIDRIDKVNKSEVRIIDYKAGRTATNATKRNWQLTLYAKAIEKDKKFKGLIPKELELEELQQPKPTKYEIQPNGDCKDQIGRNRAFNINETYAEILITAKKIEHDKKNGFKTTTNDSACENCDYKLYCKKWE